MEHFLGEHTMNFVGVNFLLNYSLKEIYDAPRIRLVGGTAIIGLLKITDMTQEQRHNKELLERFVRQR